MLVREQERDRDSERGLCIAVNSEKSASAR